MKTNSSSWLSKAWMAGRRWRSLFALALMTATSSLAFGQATVTTLTDSNHGKAGYKNGNTFSQALFRSPAGIALDPSGSYLFMADTTNNAIRMITAVGDKSASLTYSVYINTDGINRPVSVAVDTSTNIYVLNRGTGKNGTLLKFDGSYIFNYWLKSPAVTKATQLTNAASMALDNVGNVYITVQSNTVIRVTPSGIKSVVGIIAVPGTSLRGIVVMQDGTLAIADAGNNGIWKMDPSNTNLLLNSYHFTGFHGAGDLIGPSTVAMFNRPEGIAKAGNNILVVTDFNNHKVKTIKADGSVNLLYGADKSTWTKPYPGWRDGTMAQGLVTVQARQPYGLTIAYDGTVYVTETYYHLLRMATGTGLPALPPPPPAAPTIWSVTTNYSSVTITWSPVTGATNYNVKRTEQSGGPYTIIATTANTTYTDTSVLGGKTYYYVVSALNAGGEGPSSDEVSAKVPLPPVPDPQIGYVDFPASTYPLYTSVFHPISSYDFYNDATIVIKGTPGSGTYYEYGYTSDLSLVPNPTTNSSSVLSDYQDGLYFSQIAPYVVAQVAPELTIKTFGAKADGSPNSAIVSATVRFKTGNPIITGNNAAQFFISDITAGAELYYTINQSDPSPTNLAAVHLAPVATPTNQWEINLTSITTNTTFKVRAYRANYQPSAIVSVTLSPTNYNANKISFGFATGPGSSKLVASPGQSFVLPVSLNLLPNVPPIYGLQFNLTVTNLGSNAVAPGAVDFGSLVGKPSPFNDGYYTPIPNLVFVSTYQPSNDPSAVFLNGAWYQSLQLNTANSQNLLAVGWLEVLGRTNLYNTTSQNLLTYPIVDGTEPSATDSQMVIGSYAFAIPTNANSSDVYQVQIGRPSATTFPGLSINPYGVPVYIDAPTDTNLVGPGSVNALKNVTIGQIKYLVGSVYPANWYNAGDFGSGNLINIDVMRVFDFAAYPIAHPPEASDLFDALDSCGNFGALSEFGYYTNSAVYPYLTNFTAAVTNYTYTYDTNNIIVDTNTTITDFSCKIYMSTYFVNVPYLITNIYVTPPHTNVVQMSYNLDVVPGVSTLFNADDTAINQIAFGDGVLDVCDVYVTFRRSLDPSLQWYQRFWTNGVRVADTGVTNHSVTANVATKTSVQPQVLTVSTSSVPPKVVFAAGAVQGAPGQTVQVPITASISGDYPLRLLMLNISVVPTSGEPPLDTQMQFTQTATELGAPYTTDSIANGNYAAVWLNSGNAGLTGDVVIGNLTVTIPANAPANAVYGVYFDHVSGSPNGLASFPCQKVSGMITCDSTP